MVDHSTLPRETFLPFSPPLIEEDEIAEVVDTLRSDWITTGPKVKRFEEEFADFIGGQAALALNSATAALHVALAALDIGPGDAVITTPMTFCSTVHVIEHVGAMPILVDVEPMTLNIDPVRIGEAIEDCSASSGGSRVRAIIPVHLYGHPCDMTSILDLAARHDLALVEDAAHALPARYHGALIGSEAVHASHPSVRSLTAFSFYATKNLTTAEGGMLVGDQELINEARIWSLHGMSRDAFKRYSAEGSWFYEVIRPGFKYNMTDLQAALGLHQLRKLERLQARRREIVAFYNEAFSQMEELQAPHSDPGVDHAWHVYALRLNLDTLTIDRGRFIEELKARNIGTSVHFIPIHIHPFYRDKYGFTPKAFPVAYREYQRMLSLPLNPRMTDQDARDVVGAVRDVVKKHRR